MKRIAASILCIGLVAVGSYLEVNHQSADWLIWAGAALAFFEAL